MGNDIVLSMSFFKFDLRIVECERMRTARSHKTRQKARSFCVVSGNGRDVSWKWSIWQNRWFEHCNIFIFLSCFVFFFRYLSMLFSLFLVKSPIRSIFVRAHRKKTVFFFFCWQRNKRKWLIIYSFDDNLCWHINRLHVRWDCVDCCWLNVKACTARWICARMLH